MNDRVNGRTKAAVENCGMEVRIGLQALARVQSHVSSTVPGALDGSRQTITNYAYALSEEVHETVREIGWKPWKEEKAANTERVVEEMADILAFLGVLTVNLAKRCNLDPDEFAGMIAKQYEKTSNKNAQRFTNGREKEQDA